MSITLSGFPDSFATKLPQLSAIRLSGEEHKQYLQGQVTCDVSLHSNNTLMHGAHCDAKGKVLSVFRLVQYQNSLLLLQPENALNTSLAALKKFGVFAKVNIEQASDLSFTLAQGIDAKIALQNIFGAIPDKQAPVLNTEQATLIYIAGHIHRYVLISSHHYQNELLVTLALPHIDEQVWNLLEIIDGFPLLTNATIEKYVPQMLNLDTLNGISFTKGCYLGQETVARMQYLGKNKKMMGLLAGQVDELNEPLVMLEKQIGENWRGAGDILNYYHADDGTLYVQAVISNEITPEDRLRIKGFENTSLTLVPLVYLPA